MESDKNSLLAEQRRIVNGELRAALGATDYVERINLCLRKGADINTTDWAGRTPLMLAVQMSSPARVNFILSKNPDLFKKDSDGDTVYDIAKKLKDSQIRQSIMSSLLKALPDAAPSSSPSPSGAAEDPPPAPAAETGGEKIRVSKPIRLSGKGGKQGPGGGFRL